MRFTLTGSLGNITKPLVIELIKAGHIVTVISSQEERSEEIHNLGAIAAIGNVSDLSFLKNTFKNADAVYTMVPPSYTTKDPIAYNHEQGKIYATAINESGVKKVVNLSSWGADNPEGCGPVTGLYFVEQELNKLQSLGISVTHLRPGYFYTNLLHSISLIKSAGIIGMNYAIDTELVLIHPTDIAKVAAIALVEENKSTEKNFRYIGSDQATLSAITTMIGNAIGINNLPYIQFSDEDALNGYLKIGINQGMASSLVQLGKATREGKMITGYLQNKPTQLGATKLSDFVNEFAKIYNS
jgi:uncharacterized protein YbjT (DUF2867 family)